MNFKTISEVAKPFYLGTKTETSFRRDISLLKLIQKQLTRYEKNKTLNMRLLLNNIILFFNVFMTKPGKEMLFSFICPKHHPIVNSVLYHLDFLTEQEMENVMMDQVVFSEIDQLLNPYS